MGVFNKFSEKMQLSKLLPQRATYGQPYRMNSFKEIMTGKSHRVLLPMFIIIGAGCLMCTAQCIRCLIKEPDVSWNRRANPEPWENFRFKRWSLLPMFIIIGAGVAMCVAQCTRCLMKEPDVSWNRRANPEPWEAYRGKRWQLLQTHSKEELDRTVCKAPKYWED